MFLLLKILYFQLNAILIVFNGIDLFKTVQKKKTLVGIHFLNNKIKIMKSP